jgi:hypothetical protein
LSGLTYLSDLALESLSSHLADEHVEKLAQKLSMEKMIITKEIAGQFLKDKDSFDLEAYGSMEDDAAKVLARHDGHLCLNGLMSISDSAAESLSKHQGSLEIDGLTSLSDGAAACLSARRGKTDCRHLRPLYKILRDFKDAGYVFIPSDTTKSGAFSTDFPTFCNDEGITVTSPSTVVRWLKYLIPCFSSIQGNIVTFVSDGEQGYFVYGKISKFKSKSVDLGTELTSRITEITDDDNYPVFEFVEQIAENYALELEMEFAP